MRYYDALIKVAICEDEQSEQQTLKHLLDDYFGRYDFCYELFAFSSGQDLLRSMQETQFSLLFLDIFMDGMDGMETARHIRRGGHDLPIIFLTSSRDFAVESYEVNALYYLIKPLTAEKLNTAMKKCADLLTASQRYLEVVSGRETVRVYLKDILYAEAFGNQIMLHTPGGDIPVYQPLDTLLQKAGDPFLRCHRSFVVNMDFIKQIDRKDFILTSGDRVPIRTNGRTKVLEQYNHYLANLARRE